MGEVGFGRQESGHSTQTAPPVPALFRPGKRLQHVGCVPVVMGTGASPQQTPVRVQGGVAQRILQGDVALMHNHLAASAAWGMNDNGVTDPPESSARVAAGPLWCDYLVSACLRTQQVVRL